MTTPPSQEPLASGTIDSGTEATVASTRTERGHGPILVLPREAVIQRTLILPTTKDRDIPALLAYRLPREVPLLLEDVDYTWRVVAREKGESWVRVDLVKKSWMRELFVGIAPAEPRGVLVEDQLVEAYERVRLGETRAQSTDTKRNPAQVDRPVREDPPAGSESPPAIIEVDFHPSTEVRIYRLGTRTLACRLRHGNWIDSAVVPIEENRIRQDELQQFIPAAPSTVAESSDIELQLEAGIETSPAPGQRISPSALEAVPIPSPGSHLQDGSDWIVPSEGCWLVYPKSVQTRELRRRIERAARPELLPETIRSHQLGQRVLRAILIVVAAALTLTISGTFGIRSLGNQTEVARTEIDARRSELQADLRQTELASFIVQRVESWSEDGDAPLRIWDRIAAGLPNSLYLTSVSFDSNGLVRIQGYTEREGTVISFLESLNQDDAFESVWLGGLEEREEEQSFTVLARARGWVVQ